MRSIYLHAVLHLSRQAQVVFAEAGGDAPNKCGWIFTDMKIVMLADWLPPEFGAVGQYALKFGRELAEQGHSVTLVGLTAGVPGVDRELYGTGALLIRRVMRPAYNKQSMRGRAWWTLRSNLALLWQALPQLRRCDEIRFTGSPPFMIHFVMPLARLMGKRTRYRITDFHPECLMAEYERVPSPLKILHRLTLYWRRRVSVMEVLGEDQRRLCLADGIRAERIELRRDPAPITITGREARARVPAELQGRHIVLYSGNWGVAHDYRTFCEGMALVEQRHPGAVGVWVNATGAKATAACHALEAAGVSVSRTDPVPLEKLAGVLVAADLHLICLRDAFVGYVLPSKVYACIDSGRPILYIGSSQSDVDALCGIAQRAGRTRYERVSVGDAAAVARAVERLLSLGRLRQERNHEVKEIAVSEFG
jgi:glycosyltransferase involved in cell wall biosynthesis